MSSPTRRHPDPNMDRAIIRRYTLGMNRNRILLAVLVVGAAVLLFVPLGRGGHGGKPLTPTDTTILTPLIGYVNAHYETPADYVVGTFDTHEIVFLGEYGKIKQNVELVQRLIPMLYNAGVRNLGIEYALSSDQPLIDKLTTAPVYDKSLANKILFDYLVIWGYQGYANLFKAAWRFNRSLPAGAPPFRIVALSVAENWQYIRTKNDANNPNILHEVFARGVPDVHMASIIEKRFLSTGEKALIYVSTKSAFTRYASEQYASSMRRMGFTQTKRAGNIIFGMIGRRSFTILFHQPWPGARSSGKGAAAVYPLGGVIDNLIAKLPADRRDAGFNVRGTVFGKLKLTHSEFAVGHPGMTFGDLCDGYIIQGKLSAYEPVAPIPSFINEQNIPRALSDFPGPKAGNLTPADLNRFIAQNLQNLGRFLSAYK